MISTELLNKLNNPQHDVEKVAMVKLAMSDEWMQDYVKQQTLREGNLYKLISDLDDLNFYALKLNRSSGVDKFKRDAQSMLQNAASEKSIHHKDLKKIKSIIDNFVDNNLSGDPSRISPTVFRSMSDDLRKQLDLAYKEMNKRMERGAHDVINHSLFWKPRFKREQRELRNKKLLLGVGGLAALGGLGYGAYKLYNKYNNPEGNNI